MENEFIVTNSGKVGFRRSEYISHNAQPIIPDNMFVQKAEIRFRLLGNKRFEVKYATDEEMYAECKEITEQLK